MARPIKEFADAWRALSGFSGTNGWRMVPVAPAGGCQLHAGRHFPGNEEALLVRFKSASIPPAAMLPCGQGFSVDRVESAEFAQGWLALSRQSSGTPELFEMMVADVAGVLDAHAAQTEAQMLKSFLSRVRGWQDFMKAGSSAMGPEAELGLAGELIFLDTIIKAGVSSAFAMSAWVGPLNAPQDFVLGTGAVEVKSTLASAGFRAKIGSLEQLDNSLRTPLFLGAARFAETASGATLPELAAVVRNSMSQSLTADNAFKDRLFAAGYIDAHADRYTRRFVLSELRILEVHSGFPRITLGTAPAGVLRAAYEIDIDQAAFPNIAPIDALQRLGVL
jgi:hypothetical protein